MKPSRALTILSILTALLVLVQAGAGLFWKSGGSPYPFTTLHGETVQISGQGIYAFDTSFKAPILRGTDAVMLFVCVPLLIAALIWARRGALRGRIMLTGLLSIFLYNSASVVLGVAYNNLFLVYTAYFSCSLFAFILAYASINAQDLSARIRQGFPRRGTAILLFISSAALLFAWLLDIVAALLENRVPAIASYTTEVTYAFDLGIIAPMAVLGGVLVLRRRPAGILLASTLLISLAVIGLVVAAQTVAQSMAGITLSTGEFIGKAGSFLVLSLAALGILLRMFRSIAETPSA